MTDRDLPEDKMAGQAQAYRAAQQPELDSYPAVLAGRGRWAFLLDGQQHGGVLYTDNKTVCGIYATTGSDSAIYVPVLARLRGMYQFDLPAHEAFDQIVADYPDSKITLGELGDLSDVLARN